MIKPDEEINQFDMETPFVYIFVREDIPPVQQVIQAAHVAHEAGIEFGPYLEGIISHFCIFGIKDVSEMREAVDIMEDNDIDYKLFFEPDFDIGYSAVATRSIVGEKRKVFADYKLLRMKGRLW